MKLSILIPHIKRHSRLYGLLRSELISQMLTYPEEIELLDDDSETDTIGAKRNRLLQRAEGDYVVFFDADDRPSVNYIQLLMEGIEKGVDCCSLFGIITTDGKDPHYFEHSLKYRSYKTNKDSSYLFGEVRYERYPNHLNCIKSSIAKQFKFPETSWGEDTDWATQIFKSRLLLTQWDIKEAIYFYNYQTDKTKML